MRRDYLSWGKIFRYSHDVHILRWSDDNISQILSQCRNVLPFGNGRSYGDVCLNANGLLLDVSHLNSFISFDKESGVLTCEAGVTIGEIIKLTVPHSWFPPVVPGTKHVTIGGAIANDIHGKNHISKGSFGCWVKRFELIKSDGSSYICSPESNRELFAATIGGMGLTGYIKWAEIQLIQGGPLIEVETKKFENFEELLRINEESRSKYEYTVAWMDLTSKGDALGRGVYIAGKHLLYPFNAHKNLTDRHRLTLPINLPNMLLNKYSMGSFNNLYYHVLHSKRNLVIQDYDQFFFPLDSIKSWNRLYGKRGLSQYQFVLPLEKVDVIKKIFELVSRSNIGSFLVVFKEFGDIISPGLLSFPKKGYTLALDFPNVGKPLWDLYRKLDQLVQLHQGKLYPAKDDHMSSLVYKVFYPNLQEFKQYVDPKFSSSFWRRVGNHEV